MMSHTQQLAARKHARRQANNDFANRSLAASVLENANNKNIIRGKLGRGLRKWAQRILK